MTPQSEQIPREGRTIPARTARPLSSGRPERVQTPADQLRGPVERCIPSAQGPNISDPKKLTERTNTHPFAHGLRVEAPAHPPPHRARIVGFQSCFSDEISSKSSTMLPLRMEPAHTAGRLAQRMPGHRRASTVYWSSVPFFRSEREENLSTVTTRCDDWFRSRGFSDGNRCWRVAI